MFKPLKLIALFALFFSTFAVAESPKIAIVDLPRAIFGTEVAKARIKQLSGGSDYASMQAKFDSINADIANMQKDAEGKSATWSKEQAAEYQKKIEYALADRELVVRKLKAEQQGLQSSIVNELQPKTNEAIKEILAEEKIDLLLSADAVLVGSPNLDITAKLTDRLNQKTK